jgi:hypothetical protein
MAREYDRVRYGVVFYSLGLGLWAKVQDG